MRDLATHLRSLGVGPEVPVGVAVERSLEVFQIQLRAMLEYRAEASGLTVHLFAATEDEGAAEGDWGWDRLAGWRSPANRRAGG